MANPTPQTVWYTRCPVPTPLGLAVQFGWVAEAFAREGIAVDSIFDNINSDVRRSHFDHHLAWSFRQGGNIPAIWTRAKGTATRLVGITWTDEFQAIITLPGSGIRTAADLPGRRFGVTRNDGSIVDINRAIAIKGLLSALSLEGLTDEEVKLTDIPVGNYLIQQRGDPQLFGLRRSHAYGAEVGALIRGEVDAIYVKGAEGIVVANLIGAHLVSEFGFHPDPKIRVNSGTPRTLTVDAAFADSRPDLVGRLLEVIDRASVWASEHPEETVRYIAREIGTSEEAVAAAHGPKLAQSLSISLDPAHVAAIDSYKNFLRDRGFLAADFEVADWVDRRPEAAIGRLGKAA